MHRQVTRVQRLLSLGSAEQKPESTSATYDRPESRVFTRPRNVHASGTAVHQGVSALQFSVC